MHGSAPSRLYLVDGHSLIYRAYFAIRGLSTSKGFPTNAVYGFTNMLIKLIRDEQPRYLAVAMDSKGPTHRHAEFAEYKAQRPEMPDSLQQQIPVIHRILSAFRIPVLIKEQYEADDLIGTLSRAAEAEGIEVTIVTGDKDLFQLIGPRVRVYDTMKDRTFENRDVVERFGVEPSRITEIMGLMGDSIDNIPGVPGIGEKTAVKLIKEFGTIENLLKNLDRIGRPKLRQSLKEHSEQAQMSRQLAMLRLDCPIELRLEDYERKPPDVEQVARIFQEFEFTALLKRLDEVGTDRASPSPIVSESPRPILVTDRNSLRALVDRIKTAGRMVIEAFPRNRWIGIGIFSEPEAFFIPIGKPDPKNPPALLKEAVLKELARALTDPEIRTTGHRLKDLALDCLDEGIEIRGLDFDTEIASYLLAPNRRDHGLETACLEHLGRSLPPFPDFPEDASPAVDSFASVSGMRIRAIFQLQEIMASALSQQELIPLFRDIEIPLIPVLADMERTGIRLDAGALRNLSDELQRDLLDIERRIYSAAGTRFNINSPKQLSKVLFEDLGLEPIKRTKTGYSTSEEVLQQLALRHELPVEILNYRQLSKLKSTYVDALPELVNPRTGRLHTSFNQTGTATGRLSSSDPNLQNIPIKGEWGKRIRAAFVADDGFQLMSFDYNQIELRILAHLSGDENLTTDFGKGNDVHRSTASKIFGVSESEITPDMRRTAKTVNFGIVYGISPYGLSSTLGIPQDEAKAYIDSYFSHYSGVKQFIDRTIEEATKRGYVATLFGRRRPIPELASPDRNTHSLGERTAVNTVIQGSAADLIKLAMIRIAERIKKADLKSRMLLQIHDELLFEVPDKDTEDSRQWITDEMERVMSLDVPLKVNAEMGPNWSDVHS